MTDENGEPLSEEVISWILATLPMGAMVGLKYEVMVWFNSSHGVMG